MCHESNISNTRKSVSSGYPTTEKWVEKIEATSRCLDTWLDGHAWWGGREEEEGRNLVRKAGGKMGGGGVPREDGAGGGMMAENGRKYRKMFQNFALYFAAAQKACRGGTPKG